MGWGEGELDEGSQKLQTSSYKMKDIMYSVINITLLYVKRINPKFLSQGNFFLSNSVSI